LQPGIYHLIPKVIRIGLSCQRGVTLIEVVVGMVLMVILLSGMARLFSGSLLIWTAEKNRTSMEQTARIAVDDIVREIRYAQRISLNSSQSLTIEKVNGEINTFQLGGGLHASTLYMIIDKRGASPVGGVSASPITENIVTTLSFTPYPDSTTIQAIIITLEVTDQRTGKIQRIHTAGYPWNVQKPLLHQGVG